MYKLRWRFDYRNRKTKCGIWGMATGNPVDSAWAQPKDGLVRASIEGKDIESREIETLAECDGHDFRSFQWVATASMPGQFSGTIVPKTQLVGLKMLTTDRVTQVLQDGSKQITNISQIETTVGMN